MIGFDRPLRPQWIYESLLLAHPGQKLSDLNKPFEEIARELTGKEGKRKVRTVLFRCFLRDESNQTKVRSDLILKDLTTKYGFEFMKPIYLFYLLAKTDTLMRISEHIFRLYDFGSEINLLFLKKKIVDTSGERDVVKRSVGAFISTLASFGVVDDSCGKPVLRQRLRLDDEQVYVVMKLYATDILGSPQLSLNDLPDTIFNYFKIPNLQAVAQKYNGVHWDYQHRIGGDLITFYGSTERT